MRQSLVAGIAMILVGYLTLVIAGAWSFAPWTAMGLRIATTLMFSFGFALLFAFVCFLLGLGCDPDCQLRKVGTGEGPTNAG